jgi:hypothetical protein
MEATKCIGKVLQDGHLSIPLNIFVDLGLTAGDEIEVRLKKLDWEKIAMKKRTADALSYSFPESKQKRLSELLFKNREEQLTKLELLELERLVFEAQLKTLEKANAMYEQRKEHSGTEAL